MDAIDRNTLRLPTINMPPEMTIRTLDRNTTPRYRKRLPRLRMSDAEKSKFVLVMHGENGRCFPCLKAKDGPCMRDPNRPHSACLFCIERNRQDECKYKKNLESTVSTMFVDPQSQVDPAFPTDLPNSVLQPRRVWPNRNARSSPSFFSRTPVSNVDTAINLSDPSTDNEDFISSSRLSSPDLFPNLPIRAILDKLAQKIDRNLVRPITDFLGEMLSSKTVPINSLRAAVIRSPEDDRPWPIVLWDEGDDTELILITRIEPGESIYSSILYCAVDTKREDRLRWRSEISWSLWSADHLKDLSRAATHVFELLIKLDPEITKSFFDRETTEIPGDELLRYATTLLPVYYRVREFEKQCAQGGKFWVEKFSEQKDVEDQDGNHFKVLSQIVDI